MPPLPAFYLWFSLEKARKNQALASAQEPNKLVLSGMSAAFGVFFIRERNWLR
jgi:hypothetical protein